MGKDFFVGFIGALALVMAGCSGGSIIQDQGVAEDVGGVEVTEGVKSSDEGLPPAEAPTGGKLTEINLVSSDIAQYFTTVETDPREPFPMSMSGISIPKEVQAKAEKLEVQEWRPKVEGDKVVGFDSILKLQSLIACGKLSMADLVMIFCPHLELSGTETSQIFLPGTSFYVERIFSHLWDKVIPLAQAEQNTASIKKGSILVAIASTAPTSSSQAPQTSIAGTAVKLIRFEAAALNADVTIEKLIATVDTNSAASDFTSIQLVDSATGALLSSAAVDSLAETNNGNATFGLGEAFRVEAGKITTLQVMGDVTASPSPATDSCAGISPQVNFSSAEPASNSLGVTEGYPNIDMVVTGNTIVVAQEKFGAALFVKMGPNASSTLTAGAQNAVISNLTLMGSSNDSTTVERITLIFGSDTQPTTGHLSDYKLFSGSTQIGSTSGSTTTDNNGTYIPFDLENSLVIPANGSTSLDLKADVDNTATSATQALTVDISASSSLITLSKYDTNSLAEQGAGVKLDYYGITGQFPNSVSYVTLQGIFPTKNASGQNTGGLLVTKTAGIPAGSATSNNVVFGFQVKTVSEDLTIQSLGMITGTNLAGSASNTGANLLVSDAIYNGDTNTATFAAYDTNNSNSYVARLNLAGSATTAATWNISDAYSPVIFDGMGQNSLKVMVSPSYSTSSSTPQPNARVYDLNMDGSKTQTYEVYADLGDIENSGEYQSVGFSVEKAVVDSNGNHGIFGSLSRYTSSSSTGRNVPAAVVVPAGTTGPVTLKPTYYYSTSTSEAMMWDLKMGLSAVYSLFRVSESGGSHSLVLKKYMTTRACF